MNTILTTERLMLREFELSDAKKMYELNVSNEVMKYTGDLPFVNVPEAIFFLNNYADYDNNGYGRWAVIEKSNNEFIGWCGLKLNEEGFVDIGFRFFEEHWGKGFATESAKACLDFGFDKLKLTEIIGRSASENKASIKVLEKLNMKFWKNDNCEGIANAKYFKITKNENNE